MQHTVLPALSQVKSTDSDQRERSNAGVSLRMKKGGYRESVVQRTALLDTVRGVCYLDTSWFHSVPYTSFESVSAIQSVIQGLDR